MKSINYQESAGLCFGFCDCKIREFLAEYPRFSASKSMLVTCIDSYPHPARLGKWLQILSDSGVHFEVFGDYVWIPTSDVARLLNSQKVFFGFDEVHFLETRPPVMPNVIERFTSDGVSFADGLPDRLPSQLAALGADRYLTDGCGLNFAVEASSAESVLGRTQLSG